MATDRIIHTGLYSNIAKEVLQSVKGQMSDGLWENSPSMEKYWLFSSIETAPDGEVLIKISSDHYDHRWRGNGRSVVNGFYDMADDEIKPWFAAKIKHIMQTELKDEGIKNGWKRNNDEFETSYLNYHETITIADVYFIYDFLKGRDVSKKYEGDMSLKIVSAPKSDEDTKKEETRHANLAKLEAEWTEARQKLDIEKRMKIQDIEDEFAKSLEFCNAKYKKLCDELK